MNGAATRRNEEVICPHCKLIGRRSVGEHTGKCIGYRKVRRTS